ncbi:hypothetical protein EC991_004737 [Linnemannia zychae]|nr:hypothetical protein EC991_004737 [Linnemannia zychae]
MSMPRIVHSPLDYRGPKQSSGSPFFPVQPASTNTNRDKPASDSDPSMSGYNLDKLLNRLEKRMEAIDSEIAVLVGWRDDEYKIARKLTPSLIRDERLKSVSGFNDHIQFLMTTLNVIEARIESVLLIKAGVTTAKSI